VIVFAVVGGIYFVTTHAASDAPALISGCVPSGAAWWTSSPTGGHSDNGYWYANNEWGAVSGSRQNIWEKSVDNWGVCDYQPNPPATVKGYPEEQKEIGKTIGSLATAKVDVAYNVPANGTWNASADLWINGHAGNSKVKEVMFWSYTHYQRPAGSKVTTANFGGQTWNVWVRSGNNPTYTLQLQKSETSGTIYLRAGLDWLVSHGYLKSSDTFTQFNWGYEIVGTGGGVEKFTTTKMSLTVN
jgi:hypothetical protein